MLLCLDLFTIMVKRLDHKRPFACRHYCHVIRAEGRTSNSPCAWPVNIAIGVINQRRANNAIGRLNVKIEIVGFTNLTQGLQDHLGTLRITQCFMAQDGQIINVKKVRQRIHRHPGA